MNGKKQGSMELPSKNEQLSLQNTEILVKSNLMRMQLKELLSNVRDSETSTRHVKIDKWLEKVCDAIKTCTITDNELSGKWLMKRNFRGLSLEDGSKSVSIIFEKPSSVQLIGSHALNTGTAPFLNCDLAVVMPKSCFDSRDILNHIYFDKRKLYLAGIAEVIAAAGLSSSIEVSYFRADQRKPFLIVKPHFASKYSMHLYPCAPTGVFKLVQLLSGKNNVRPESWMRELQLRRAEPVIAKHAGSAKSVQHTREEENLDASSLAPTPHYNMAILEDLAIVPQHRMLSKASESCPCFKEVCILLKVWLVQKNLRFGVDDVGGHCINIIVAYLFQIRRIGQQTSLLGAFQIVLRFIEETDFSATDLYFAGGTSNRNDGSWSAKLYHPVGKDADEVQFNSLWRVSSSALQDLRNESKVALGLLQLDSDVGFNRIFLQGSHYLSRYDLIFHVPLDLFSDSASTAEEEDMTVCQFVSSKALSVARQALNNRVKAISSSVRNVCISGTSSTSSSVSSWDIKSFSKRPSDSYVVTIGLVIDNEHAHRRVDKGVDPSLDESTASDGMMTAADFRSFWGAKSELRRFRDGAIVDAVVWGDQVSDTGTSKSREVTGESIVESIVRYSLGMHLSSCSGTKGERIVSLGSCLEEALPAADYIRRNLSEDTGNQKALDATINSRYVKAVESLDRLRGILTSDMKDLPLVFESISGSQASLRYTSLLPPVPNPLLVNSKDMLKAYSGVSLSLIAHPMLLIGQVEGGGKWPSEREAAKKIKTALLLRTAHLLRNQFQISSQPAHDHLDIFFDGFIFRLVIFFSSEDTADSEIRELQSSMLHHQSIRAIHTRHGDSFSSSVRLLSLWLSRHFFSGFLSQRQVELLAATSFVDSTAVHAPTTSASALFRILDMLGKHDFALSPLVVNLDVDGGKEQGSKLAAQALNVIHSSKVKSGSSLFILSSNDILGYDEADALPADSAIEKVSLSLIQRCASESALHLMSRALDNGTSSESANTLLFEDGTLMDEQCNLVLHFSSSLHSKGSRGHLTGPKFASLKVYANTVHTSCNPSRLVIADPSSSSENVVQEEIVAKLRSRFQDIAIFFWDETVGDRLGVIFKPSAFLSTAFSSTNSSRKMPTNDGPKSKAPMISDISQIAASIYACGNGSFCDISFR